MRLRPFATALLAFLVLPAAACTPDFEPLVVFGFPAPGEPDATVRVFMSVAPGGAPDAGLVRSGLTLADGSQEDGAWLSPPWRPAELLVRSGAPIDALGGAQFDAAGFLGVTGNVRGEIAVSGQLEVGVGGVTQDDDFALLRYRPGRGFSVVARKGEEAPGLPGFRFLSFGTALTPSGAIASRSLVSDGTEFSQGIWVFADGTRVLAYHVGQQVPGSPPGTTISANGFGAPSVAGDAVLGFRAHQERAGGFSAGQVILRWTPSRGLERIAGAGDPAPGTGTTFESFVFASRLPVSDAGDIVFDAFLTETATLPRRHSLWRARPDGTLERLVVAGDPVVNEPGMQVVGNRSYSFDDGHVTFFGGLLDAQGDVSEGLFQVAPGADIELIIERFDPLPGHPNPNATLNSLRGFRRLPDGRIVFKAISTRGGSVLAVTDPVLGLQSFFAEEERIEVAPGDVRMVRIDDLFRVASKRAVYAELHDLGFVRIKIPASSEGPVCDHLSRHDPLAKLCFGYCELLRCDRARSPRHLCTRLAEHILDEAIAPSDDVPICRR